MNYYHINDFHPNSAIILLVKAKNSERHPEFLFFFFFFFIFLGLHLQHVEVSRLGVKTELQLQAYATATATWDPSLICDLHHSSRQHKILNGLSKARD